MAKKDQGVKCRAPRNRTIALTDVDRTRLRNRLLVERPVAREAAPPEGVVCADYADWLSLLPSGVVDLLFLDPPYNLTKSFNGLKFSRKSEAEYTQWLGHVLRGLVPLLKPSATVYICGDWRTSHSIFEAASQYFVIQNREREGPRRHLELEERQRGYLVLHGHGRILLQRGCGQTASARPRALHDQ